MERMESAQLSVDPNWTKLLALRNKVIKKKERALLIEEFFLLFLYDQYDHSVHFNLFDEENQETIRRFFENLPPESISHQIIQEQLKEIQPLWRPQDGKPEAILQHAFPKCDDLKYEMVRPKALALLSKEHKKAQAHHLVFGNQGGSAFIHISNILRFNIQKVKLHYLLKRVDTKTRLQHVADDAIMDILNDLMTNEYPNMKPVLKMMLLDRVLKIKEITQKVIEKDNDVINHIDPTKLLGL